MVRKTSHCRTFCWNPLNACQEEPFNFTHYCSCGCVCIDLCFSTAGNIRSSCEAAATEPSPLRLLYATLMYVGGLWPHQQFDQHMPTQIFHLVHDNTDFLACQVLLESDCLLLQLHSDGSWISPPMIYIYTPDFKCQERLGLLVCGEVCFGECMLHLSLSLASPTHSPLI